MRLRKKITMKQDNMDSLIKERKESQDFQDALSIQIKKVDKVIDDAAEIQKELNYRWNKEDEDLKKSRYYAFFSEKNAESKGNYKNVLYQLSESKSLMQKELKKQREKEAEISFKISKEKGQRNG